jgi:U3 small nucleolar RNA-associated protein 21
MASSSNLFDAFRAVGLIASGKMTKIKRMGDARNFTTCPAGRAFYVYDCDSLRVSLASRPIPTRDDISSLVTSGSDITVVAAGKRIFMFKRAECVGEFLRSSDRTIPAHDDRVSLLCNFNSGDILLSIDTAGKLQLWNLATMTNEQVQCDLGSEFRASFILHPKTYLNKVLIGGEAGLLQLWNFRSGKLVYAFKEFASVPIHCAEQSPAIDVVALGMDDGAIVLHNLRFDRSLFRLHHAAKSSVTSLDFFSYNNAGEEAVSILASGNKLGEICLWNLNERTIMHVIPFAHSRPILSLSFLPGEFVLLSSGADNCIQSWQLDSVTFQPRKLKSREGHFRAPNRVRFHPQGSTIATLSSGSDGRALQLLSSGPDKSLRTFHCTLENHAKELSQKCEEQRLPTILSIAASEAREKDWFNVVTTHIGDNNARVWRFEKGTLGEGLLNMRSKGYEVKSSGKRKHGGNDSDFLSPAISCIISNCGNFAYIGSASGIVSQYNLQSGRFLASFPKQIWDVENEEVGAKQNAAVLKRKKTAAPGSVYATTGETRTTQYSKARDEYERHSGSVTGMCLDGLDEILITVGYDSTLRVWDSESQSLVETINLGGSPVTQLERTRDGGLFAVALENLSVVVFDSLTRKLVRQFTQAHRAKITDMCFSPNARWLLTSSTDTTLRVWDLSTSRCVDWVRFPKAVTSMSFSPSNEYLATSHADCLAICLWANKVHFASAKADKVAKAAVDVDLPCFSRTDDDDAEYEMGQDEKFPDHEGDESTKSVLKATGDIRGTVTLSCPPAQSTRWFTLWHLELIKERNRPVQPPEKPAQVPFFLPNSAENLDTLATDTKEAKGKTKDAKSSSKILSSAENSFGSLISPLSMQLEELVAKSRLVEAPKLDTWHRGRSSSFSGLPTNSKKTKDVDSDSDDSEADDEARARYLNVKRALAFNGFVDHMNSLSPSAIDYELRSLSVGPEDEEGARVLSAWLEWILYELKAKMNFELVQSILGRMIKVHGETFQAREELRRILAGIRDEQKLAWRSLQGMMQKSLCYVESFSQLNGL